MIPRAYVITLQDTIGLPRWQATEAHLRERGVSFEPFLGINGARWGLATTLVYAEDGPGTGFKIGSKTIGMTLSHYMLWKLFNYLEGDYWMVCEDDVRFHTDWRERLQRALETAPPDWDMIYAGSCNCGHGQHTQVGHGLYQVGFPMCTHCYIVRRKALLVLYETQQLAWAGIDLQLGFRSFPKLKVYTILPRLAEQHETIISP